MSTDWIDVFFDAQKSSGPVSDEVYKANLRTVHEACCPYKAEVERLKAQLALYCKSDFGVLPFDIVCGVVHILKPSARACKAGIEAVVDYELARLREKLLTELRSAESAGKEQA